MIARASICYAAVALAQLSLSAASPVQEQLVFNVDADVQAPRIQDDSDFNVLHHLSGISPFFDSHGPTPEAPEGCVVTSASIIARHSSITMNDDEFPEAIEPFLANLKKYRKKHKKSKAKHTALAFLKDWQTPVTEDNMEELTGPGAEDARTFGKRLAQQYKFLLPKSKDPAMKIYSASSPRDVDSSTAFISGLFPNRTLGRGQGQVDLVKVPNKNEDWAFSLTPHKICDRFDKKQGKKERDAFQKKAAKAVIARLQGNGELPGWKWHWTDIIAMQQLCGYETAIKGSSKFCPVFTQTEWEDFEYGQDLYYYYMLGRFEKWSAALGVPWLQIATKKLNETRLNNVVVPPVLPTEVVNPLNLASTTTSSFELPKPTAGPNATLPQGLHVWFTHREEIPLITGALDLFHGHDDAARAMPLHKVNPDRVWKTSEIIPFLGHVSLERMECAAPEDSNHRKLSRDQQPTEPFVRIIVNGLPQEQPGCHNGPGGSCPLEEFFAYVANLPNEFGELKDACAVKSS